MIICGTCLKPIENPHGNQKFHQGFCMEEGRRIRCREHARKHLPRKDPIHMICPYCERPYITSRDDSVSCPEEKCKNAYRCKRAKEKWEAMTLDERKALRQNKYKASKISTDQYKHCASSEILCKCPGCGAWHIKRFEYGYERKPGTTPLFNCSNFPGCISENIGLVVYEVYAGENECRI